MTIGDDLNKGLTQINETLTKGFGELGHKLDNLPQPESKNEPLPVEPVEEKKPAKPNRWKAAAELTKTFTGGRLDLARKFQTFANVAKNVKILLPNSFTSAIGKAVGSVWQRFVPKSKKAPSASKKPKPKAGALVPYKPQGQPFADVIQKMTGGRFDAKDLNKAIGFAAQAFRTVAPHLREGLGRVFATMATKARPTAPALDYRPSGGQQTAPVATVTTREEREQDQDHAQAEKWRHWADTGRKLWNRFQDWRKASTQGAEAPRMPSGSGGGTQLVQYAGQGGEAAEGAEALAGAGEAAAGGTEAAGGAAAAGGGGLAAAGAATGPIAIAVAAIAAVAVVSYKVGKAMAELPERMRATAEAALEAQRKYGEVSVAMAQVITRFDIEKMQSTRRIGDASAGTAGYLADQTIALNKSLEAQDVFGQNVSNAITGFETRLARLLTENITEPIFKWVNDKLGWTTPGNEDDGSQLTFENWLDRAAAPARPNSVANQFNKGVKNLFGALGALGG